MKKAVIKRNDKKEQRTKKKKTTTYTHQLEHMKATTGILVFACLWIMAAASVDIDHYYCTKFGDVSVYGQFYTTETAAPEPSKNALNLLFSSFDDVTGIDAEDIYSYDKGFIYPPSVNNTTNNNTTNNTSLFLIYFPPFPSFFQ